MYIIECIPFDFIRKNMAKKTNDATDNDINEYDDKNALHGLSENGTDNSANRLKNGSNYMFDDGHQDTSYYDYSAYQLNYGYY